VVYEQAFGRKSIEDALATGAISTRPARLLSADMSLPRFARVVEETVQGMRYANVP
jgi:hypothetical protein